VPGQLHAFTDLWLVQLPSFWQDVPAQHTRHSTHRQFDRHCLWQRLDLVESDLLQCRLSEEECRRPTTLTLHLAVTVLEKVTDVTHFLLILIMEEFWKSVNIWWSYTAYKNVQFFGPPCSKAENGSVGYASCVKWNGSPFLEGFIDPWWNNCAVACNLKYKHLSLAVHESWHSYYWYIIETVLHLLCRPISPILVFRSTTGHIAFLRIWWWWWWWRTN